MVKLTWTNGTASISIFLLLFEVLEIMRISSILRTLFIFGKPFTIVVLGDLGLAFVVFPFALVKAPPILTDALSNLNKGKSMAFEDLSHFCSIKGQYCRRRQASTKLTIGKEYIS